MSSEIPKGWRQLGPFEDIQKGDRYRVNGRWEEVAFAVGSKAVAYSYYVFIRFEGIGTGYFGTKKKYRSIDDV